MGPRVAVAVSGLAALGLFLVVAGSDLETVWGSAGLGIAVFVVIALAVGATDRHSRRTYHPLPLGTIPAQRAAEREPVVHR